MFCVILDSALLPALHLEGGGGGGSIDTGVLGSNIQVGGASSAV